MNVDLSRARETKPPCPLWKKVVAGVLVVIAVALSATVWLAPPESSSIETLTGLAVIFGASIALVAGGIALVTGLLWILSRSATIMRHGRAVVAYVVHCYPQQIKDRILSH
jgi:hypothetical protein